MARNMKKAQKSAEKRKKRELLIRQEKARAKASTQGGSQEKIQLLNHCDRLPIWECVISQGWGKRGLAHILMVRDRGDGALLVGGYFVDFWCVGLKACAAIPSVAKDEYANNVRNNIFNDDVEFEPIEPGVALALVEGAIAYAAEYGFRPNRHWPEARKLFRGIEPIPTGLTFGVDGKPCLVLRDRDSLAGAQARLERRLPDGAYLLVDERSADTGGATED